MRLYIVRHAPAAPGIDDENRPLTEEGMARMREAAAGLRSLGYVPELLLSSPLVRAVQTADILLHAFAMKVEMKIVRCLAPPGNRRDLYRQIAGCSKTVDSLMLVGHQPSLGEIAGEIAWGSPEHRIDLKKGGVCALDIDSVQGVPKGHLLSLLPPSILRSAAGRKPQSA